MPLTESEFHHQRAMASAKAKSVAKGSTDENLLVGTAVNPRERPRGMTPSTSLISFNQPNQRPPAVTNAATSKTISPPTSASSTRSESASKLMFDDDFSLMPSHAISLNNIPNVVTAERNERPISRARPAPSSAGVSGPSPGLSLQQQVLLPPPSNNVHTHRRSASQTISPTNNQSSFHKASSVDSSSTDQSSDDDDDQLRTNLHVLKLQQYAKMNSQSNSDDDQVYR